MGHQQPRNPGEIRVFGVFYNEDNDEVWVQADDERADSWTVVRYEDGLGPYTDENSPLRETYEDARADADDLRARDDAPIPDPKYH